MIHQVIDFFKVYPGLSSVLIFIFGLCIGSFLNVCIVRFPKEESVAKGRSRCPHCGETIAWFDNIPLLSILILKGKCRHCKKPISIRYPLVELLTAVSLTGLYHFLGPTVQFVFYGYLISSLIIVTFVDFKHQIIPDEVSITGILFGLAMSFFFPVPQGEFDKRLALADSSLGMLVGIGLIYGVAILGQFLFKKESMGGGDLKLLAMIGAFVGFQKTLLTFFIAPLIATPIGLVLRITKKVEIIPFGPYLSLAAIIALIWGREILARLFPF